MKSFLQPYAPSKNIFSLLLAVSGFLLIFWSLKGIGISADSITYASVSRNVVHHGALRAFDGDYFVDFPLGYPLFLATIQCVTRLDPISFGLVLNALMFALLLYILGCMLRDEGLPVPERYLAGICILVSPAMLQVYEMLWSETLFIIWITLFIAAGVHYGRTRNWSTLLAMAILAALSAVTRYAGVTVIATGGIALLCDREIKFPKRFVRAVVFGIISISLLSANIIHNWSVSGTATGDRQKNFLPLVTHLKRLGGVLSSSMPPVHDYPSVYLPSAIIFIVCVGGAFLYYWLRRRETFSLFSLCSTFSVIYTAFIIATALITEYEGLDVRLLAPMYIPALLAVVGCVTHVLHKTLPRKRLPASAIPMVSMLILFTAANAVMDKEYLDDPTIAYKGYVRYDMETLKTSPILEFINTHTSLFGPEVSVYSNAPDLMYVYTPQRRADYLPELRSVEDVKDFKDDRGAYVIWINACLAYPKSYLERLNDSASLTLTYQFPDGAIYIRK